MESLQSICCAQLISSYPMGSKIPYNEIPGTTGNWIRGYLLHVNLKIEIRQEVIEMIIECIEYGSATRINVDNVFRKEVHVLSERLGLGHGSNKKNHKKRKRNYTKCLNYADMHITRSQDWVWELSVLKRRRRKINRSLDGDYPEIRKMVLESCLTCEDVPEREILDNMFEIKFLPKKLRYQCIDRLKSDGVILQKYDLDTM